MKRLTNSIPALILAIVFSSGTLLAQHFSPVPGTGDYSIVIMDAEINGMELEGGDEIGVFDYWPDEFTGNLYCVGMVDVPFGVNWDTQNLAIMAVESIGAPVDSPGYVTGQPIRFRIWDASQGVEISAEADYTVPDAQGGNFGVPPLTATVITAVYDAVDEQPGDIPTVFSVSPLYPNPFNGSTELQVSLPEPGELEVAVYSSLGREYASWKQPVRMGMQRVVLQKNLFSAAGTYLVSLKFGDEFIIRRAIYLK